MLRAIAPPVNPGTDSSLCRQVAASPGPEPQTGPGECHSARVLVVSQ